MASPTATQQRREPYEAGRAGWQQQNQREPYEAHGANTKP